MLSLGLDDKIRCETFTGTGDFLGVQQAVVSNAARTGATIAKKLKISWK